MAMWNTPARPGPPSSNSPLPNQVKDRAEQVDQAEGANPARQVFERAQRMYDERFGLAMLPPLGFENSFAILIRGAMARELGLSTISDAVPHTADLESWIQL